MLELGASLSSLKIHLPLTFNMRSMYPGGSADIHLVKIKGNVTPGNKEFSLLRNMSFFRRWLETSLYCDMQQRVLFLEWIYWLFEESAAFIFRGKERNLFTYVFGCVKTSIIYTCLHTKRQQNVTNSGRCFYELGWKWETQKLRSGSSEIALNVRLLIPKNYTS